MTRRRLALVVLLLLVPAAAAAECPACLKAGAAAVALAPPPGTPMAGYGSWTRRFLLPDVFGRHPHAFWFKPADGELDPLAARALVLETPAARMVWIAADVVAVDRGFTAAVRRRLEAAGIAAGTLIVSASHTHSGPGGFLDAGFMALAAMDRHDTTVADALLDRIVDVVRRAEATRVPARVATGALAAPALTVPRLDAAPDPELVVVKLVTEANAPLALVWNYAIHGTVLGARNRRFSGDVMGEASRRLERDLGVPALFVNGAVGDVSPRDRGRDAMAAAGEALAAAVRAAAASAQVHDASALVTRSVRVPLPSAAVTLRNCLGRWLPRAVRVPLAAFPHDAELIAVALGGVAWVTVPGELQSRLGQTVKQAARARWPHAFVAGLSNDYLGYFVTAEDFDRVDYVTCASLYGAGAGDRLAAAAIELLTTLGP